MFLKNCFRRPGSTAQQEFMSLRAILSFLMLSFFFSFFFVLLLKNYIKEKYCCITVDDVYVIKCWHFFFSITRVDGQTFYYPPIDRRIAVFKYAGRMIYTHLHTHLHSFLLPLILTFYN
jgi:hypothetical protein